MKMKKLTAAAAALMTAFTVMNGTGAAALTADREQLSFAPVKAPKDYETAIAFRNANGAFYIDNSYGRIMMVFEEPEDKSEEPRFRVEASDVMREASHEIYYLPDDLEGAMRYQYEVVYYNLFPYNTGTVSLIDTELPEGEQTVESYQFESLSSGWIRSTDLYEWLPDSPEEFTKYVNGHGEISVHNNYIVCCLTDTASTPYQWKENTTLAEKQERIKKVLSDSFTKRLIPAPSGGPVYSVEVYEALQDGPAEIAWAKQSFDETEEPLETISETFQIVKNAKYILAPNDALIQMNDAGTGERVLISHYGEYAFSVTTDVGYYDEHFLKDGGDGWVYTGPVFEVFGNPYILHNFSQFFHADQFSFRLNTPEEYKVLEEQTEITHYDNGSAYILFNLEYQVSGDMDNDQIFSPLDAHLLSRWLKGERHITLENWSSADYNGNGILDAGDLTLMKRALLTRAEELPCCTMHVISSYSGYGVDGHDLGSGSDEYTYMVQPNDIFYEDEYDRGLLLKNKLNHQEEYEIPVLKILGVYEDGVKVLGGYPDEPQEMLIPYDEPQKDLVYSIHIIYDGTNYSFTVTFTDYQESPSQTIVIN